LLLLDHFQYGQGAELFHKDRLGKGEGLPSTESEECSPVGVIQGFEEGPGDRLLEDAFPMFLPAGFVGWGRRGSVLQFCQADEFFMQGIRPTTGLVVALETVGSPALGQTVVPTPASTRLSAS